MHCSPRQLRDTLQEVGNRSATNDLEADVTAGASVVALLALALMNVPLVPLWLWG